eukprot:g42675.t1
MPQFVGVFGTSSGFVSQWFVHRVYNVFVDGVLVGIPGFQELLVSLHTDEEGHELDWDNTSTIAQAKQRQAREFLEAWYSYRNSINKHIELDPVNKPLRNRTGSNTKHPNKPRHRVLKIEITYKNLCEVILLQEFKDFTSFPIKNCVKEQREQCSDSWPFCLTA